MAAVRGRGRPRKRNRVVPPHIDARKLPDYCYWDPRGKGLWYTVFTVDEKPRSKKIAGPDATLAELHKVMEQRAGNASDCLNWIAGKFAESPQFKTVSKKQKKDWIYCRKIVTNYPTAQLNISMGQIPLEDWDPPLVQKLIDGIALARGPSASKHAFTYLQRLYNWSINRGYVKRSPVVAIELPKERKRRRLPLPAVVSALCAFAHERGQRKRGKGSCSPYIFPTLEIAYLVRQRGIEVFGITDADIHDIGMDVKRTKGSDDNFTIFNDRLDRAVKYAQAYRDALWAKKKMPVPFRPEDRPLIVSEDGIKLKQQAWQNGWKRFLNLAIKEKIITQEQWFGLHDMKRRGITDTPGTKADKMAAGGHKDPRMLEVYDFSVPRVKPTAE